jgi:hypothetical protein
MSTDAVPAVSETTAASTPVPFPSLSWFQRLAALMNDERPLHEKLGYVDCLVRFTVRDGGASGSGWSAEVRFEEFEAVEVREVSSETSEAPDFILDASLGTWRSMIESIDTRGGKPALEQTLNRLNLEGSLLVNAADPLGRDMFFRFNQSLQAFVNASGRFETSFDLSLQDS